MKIIAIFLGFLLSILSFSTTGECELLREGGTFVYDDEDGDMVVVVIENNKHTEHHKGNKYIVESDIKWISDCEYNASLVKATLPDMTLFKKGDILNIKVDKIDGDDIYYTGTIKKMKFKGKMTKTREF